jgi:hypothetical protein
MSRSLNRLLGRFAAAFLVLGLAVGTAAAQQASAPPNKAPVTISQADIDALRAMLGGSAATAEYLKSLNGAVIQPNGMVQGTDKPAKVQETSLGSKMATAFGGLVSDHDTYASFSDASNTKLNASPADH